jgi:hypothetical protein
VEIKKPSCDYKKALKKFELASTRISHPSDILPARIQVFPGRLTGTAGIGSARNGGKKIESENEDKIQILFFKYD